VESIPRIDEMSERLARFGWSAVAVDGFVPPRAFQAFQSHGILPIAADIRTSKHLAYTPAPDIIHEAAGHAPFLADPHYGRFVRRIGAIAERAFSSQLDHDAYEAIHLLSELKEDPGSTNEQIARAEALVHRATQGTEAVSESARIARLYWWTVEYGLVGTLSDYRVYGAGLLSSLGESHSCHGAGIRKLPLSARVAEVGYDITSAQPQLFVAPSFAELDVVLDQVSEGLAFRVGGDFALRVAEASAEVATVEVDGGGAVSGVVSGVVRSDGDVALVHFSGRCALSARGRLLDAMPQPDSYALPVGRLRTGESPSELSPAGLDRNTADNGVLTLRFASGVVIRGQRLALVPDGGRALTVLLGDVSAERGGTPLFTRRGPYPLLLGGKIVTAYAGAPEGYFEDDFESRKTVPGPRRFSAAHLEKIALFERAVDTFRTRFGAEVAGEVESIASAMDRQFPEEWLLRWTLLEGLARAGQFGALTSRLENELELLEVRFQRLEPIATGLAYVRALLSNDPKKTPARAG
jgi:phenylalanine-4-hydroxylase